MALLNYEVLAGTGYDGYILKDAPEKVMQFGEGNFLRAFVDYFFDMANEKVGWNGKVALVQPIAMGLTEYINNLGLASTITYILGANDVKEGKPNPEAVLKTLEKYNIPAEEAIVVGDTVFDIEMGRNAGVKTCGVTYGSGSRESLSNADWLIDDFRKLLELTA